MIRTQTYDDFNYSNGVQFFFDRVGNIVEKGENAGNQYFLLFPQYFNISPFQGLYPLPGGKILDESKLKQIANDILKCI